MQKGSIGVLILFLVLLAAVGGGAYYLGQHNASVTLTVAPTPKLITSATSHPTLSPALAPKASPLPTSSSLQSADVVPINAKAFSISTGNGQCNTPTDYTINNPDGSFSSEMQVKNGTGCQDVDQLNIFLSSEKIFSEFQDVSFLESPFHDYAGGGYMLYLYAIKGINYPGMDEVKALATLTGQSYSGDLDVYVYAKKGDKFIQLDHFIDGSKTLPNSSLAEQCMNKYEANPDSAVKCYESAMLNDPTVAQQAKAAAENLVSTFAIQ